jgi:hypothetical protein
MASREIVGLAFLKGSCTCGVKVTSCSYKRTSFSNLCMLKIPKNLKSAAAKKKRDTIE